MHPVPVSHGAAPGAGLQCSVALASTGGVPTQSARRSSQAADGRYVSPIALSLEDNSSVPRIAETVGRGVGESGEGTAAAGPLQHQETTRRNHGCEESCR